MHVCWCLLFFKSSGDIAAKVSLQTHISETDGDHVRLSIDGCRRSLAPPCRTTSEERVVVVCLCLRAGARSGGKGKQGPREVGRQVQGSGRRLCERGREDGQLLGQGQRQRRAVGHHVRRQR